MNLSLKRRIAGSFILANVMVMIIGFTVFYYLNSLNEQIKNITSNTNQISLLTDEIRISAVSILKMQKKILTNKAKEDDLENLNSLCNSFHTQLENLDAFYTEVQIKTIISKMIGYVDSLQTLLSKVSLNNYRDSGGISAIGRAAPGLGALTCLRNLDIGQGGGSCHTIALGEIHADLFQTDNGLVVLHIFRNGLFTQVMSNFID